MCISQQISMMQTLRTRTIWNRYSGSINYTRNPQAISIYIYNLNNNHYDPVIRLINSDYDSLEMHDPIDLTVAEKSNLVDFF